MRVKLCMTVALTFVLCGCGVDVLTTAAIEGELQAQTAKQAVGQLNEAKEQSNLITLRQSVSVYQAENGVPPQSLQALVPEYLPVVPERTDGKAYGYNPLTGNVLGARDVNAGLRTDTQTMRTIQQAIVAYGTSTGYYPTSLDVLVPQFLSESPRNCLGQPFAYNPTNGALSNPAEALRSEHAGQTPSGGGGGPLGELMTGINMQNQLNGMSSGGSSGAGSRMRNGINRSTQRQEQQQDALLNDMGL